MIPTVVLPGLLWPNAGAHGLLDGVAHPTLERWLAVGACRRESPRSYRETLATVLGPAPAPLAELRRRGETGAPASPGGFLLCADPVTLTLARDRIVVTEPGEAGLDSKEAAALASDLSAWLTQLAPEWILGFELARPQRGYLRLAAPAEGVRFVPLDEASGRSLDLLLPQGEDARRWRRLMNEIQVWLHAHPVNAERRRRGWPTLDSLWLWGNEQPTANAVPFRRVLGMDTLDPLARGWASAAGHDLVLAGHDTGQTFDVALLDAAEAPCRRLDLTAWRTALAALDRDWLAGFEARLPRLSLLLPGDKASVRLEITPSRRRLAPLRRLFRSPHTLARLLEETAQ
ncbi:hypothetical protein [Tepidiphilus olei]|uniref:hypothetical protein n=1 Tax=Tepidiphilus olei TaxID=2502184 RepID=UPI00115D7333|nr:hypothetical protein [Tepidiphilus olei]